MSVTRPEVQANRLKTSSKCVIIYKLTTLHFKLIDIELSACKPSKVNMPGLYQLEAESFVCCLADEWATGPEKS